MRNSILPIAIAAVLAVPCTALVILGCSPSLADDKPKESVTFGCGGKVEQNYQAQKPDGSGRLGPATTQKKHIGGLKYEDVQSQPKGPLNTTVNPALQGNVLQKSTVGGTVSGPSLLGGSGATTATSTGQTNKTRVDPYKNYNFR